MQLGKYEEALNTLNNLININNSKSIKAKYMLALTYLNLNDKVPACKIIDEIKDEPLVKSIELQRFCD